MTKQQAKNKAKEIVIGLIGLYLSEGNPDSRVLEEFTEKECDKIGTELVVFQKKIIKELNNDSNDR